MEKKAFEVLLYLSIVFLLTMQPAHKKDAFVYKWIHFGSLSYIHAKFDNFSTRKCQQLKSVKKLVHKIRLPPVAPTLKILAFIGSILYRSATMNN